MTTQQLEKVVGLLRRIWKLYKRVKKAESGGKWNWRVFESGVKKLKTHVSQLGAYVNKDPVLKNDPSIRRHLEKFRSLVAELEDYVAKKDEWHAWGLWLEIPGLVTEFTSDLEGVTGPEGVKPRPGALLEIVFEDELREFFGEA